MQTWHAAQARKCKASDAAPLLIVSVSPLFAAAAHLLVSTNTTSFLKGTFRGFVPSRARPKPPKSRNAFRLIG